MGLFIFERNKKEEENMQLKKALREFRLPLLKIMCLSKRLNYPGFTKTFEKALEILDSKLSEQDKAKQIIVKTQILGGMWSWNDSPPWTAYHLGIEKEFESITIQFSQSRKILIETMK